MTPINKKHLDMNSPEGRANWIWRECGHSMSPVAVIARAFEDVKNEERKRCLELIEAKREQAALISISGLVPQSECMAVATACKEISATIREEK